MLRNRTIRNLPSPALVLGFLLATLYGSAFHLLFGGDARRLATFLIAGWLGFAIGNFLGGTLAISLFDIGLLHVFSATVGSLLALLITHVLTSRTLDEPSLIE